MKRKFLLLFGTLLLALSSVARDFSYTYKGKRLNYTVLNEEAKTCQLRSGDYRNPGSSVSGDVEIPEKAYIGATAYDVIAIGVSAFGICQELTSIVIPKTVENIRSCAFYSCAGLTSIRIPDGVHVIESLAFSGCTGISSIEIGNSLMSIAEGAFGGCPNVDKIAVSADNKYFSSVDGVLFDKKQSTLLIYPAQKLSASYSIPNSVTQIAKGAFSHCSNLKTVVIPSSMTSIGESAFRACESLEKIDIPESVTSIGNEAFSFCTNLTSISIPKNITTIAEYTFYKCVSLSKFEIPESVKSIERYAFGECTNLAEITIPTSVTSIGDGAFLWCNMTSINIPASVTSIGDGPFSGCGNLKSIVVDSRNANYQSIGGVLFDKTGKTIISYPAGKKENTYLIPTSVTTIGNYAFGGCAGLTAMDIPNTVTSIGVDAFSGCTGLVSVELPSSIKSISDYTFYGCTSLKSITFPASVTSIGDWVFSGCDELDTITSLAITPPTCTSLTFYNFYNKYYSKDSIILYVPEKALTAYKAAEYWKNFKNIETIEGTGAISETEADGVRIFPTAGSIEVSGVERVQIYNLNGALVYSGRGGRIELPAGIYVVRADGLTQKVNI